MSAQREQPQSATRCEERPDLLAAPQRIVSLVPSLTEALFALGLGHRVVAVTDWCIHPAAAVARLPKVGGTKNPDIARALAADPDLVLANREENTKRSVDALRGAGVPVWVTDLRDVDDAVALLRDLFGLGAPARAWDQVVRPVAEAVAEAGRRRSGSSCSFFCPIWRDPWMSVGADTFAHALLELCGGRNIFAARGGRRYPIVELSDVEVAQPEVILLPSEPYAFGAGDVAELRRLAVPAAQRGRIHTVDGTAVTWYGPRIPAAIALLRPLLRASA